MRIVAVILFAAAVMACAANATSVGDLFREFGLFGTWAINCAAQPSPSNPHVHISEPTPGVVLERHDLGRSYAKNQYSVLTAEKVSATELAVQVIFQPGTEAEQRQKLIFRVRDGTRRTLFNQTVSGAVRVRGGIAVGRGVKTPLLRKCE